MSRKGKKQKKHSPAERKVSRARLKAEQESLAGYKARLTPEEKRFLKTGKEDVPAVDKRERKEAATEAWVTSLMNQEPERMTKRKGTSSKGAYFLDVGGVRRPYKRKKK